MTETLIFVFFVLIFRIIHKRGVIDNHTYGQSQKIIHRTIPSSITLGKVIIHCYHVYALAS